MSREDVRVAHDAIAAFNSGGVEAVLEHFDPNVEWIAPPGWLEDHLYMGHDGIKKIASLWTEHFDEYRLDLYRTIDAGDDLLALLYQRARIKGTCDEIEQPVAYDWELHDGKATRVHVYFSWEAALEAVELSE
jgi:ketosteroid isomerase-like protein